MAGSYILTGGYSIIKDWLRANGNGTDIPPNPHKGQLAEHICMSGDGWCIHTAVRLKPSGMIGMTVIFDGQSDLEILFLLSFPTLNGWDYIDGSSAWQAKQ